MSDMYWYMEYGKVLAAYAALIYVWPSVIFRAYLRGKGLTFRFLFCVTVPVVLYNGVILGLGLLHILNVWLTRLLFYGAFLVSVGLPLYRRRREEGLTLKALLADPMLRRSPKLQLACLWEKIWGKALEKGREFCRGYRKHWSEYLILTVLLLFGMAFFSYPALRNCNYGTSDSYVHSEWLLNLRGGQTFSGGIYPQGMHCLMYGMSVFFGVRIYSCLLYLAGIHITAFLVSVYLLMRELFFSRYTPLFVLTLFLTFDGFIANEVRYDALMSMTRLTWTIPQEFGWYLAFLSPLLLFRFFRERDSGLDADSWFRDPNLLLLAAAVGASAAVHFYATLMGFFLCLLVLLLHIRQLRPGRRFLSLVCVAWDGLIAGAFPMLIAYMQGRKVEPSLRWGVNTIWGKTGRAAEMITNQEAETMEAGKDLLTGLYEKGYAMIFGESGTLVMTLVLMVPLLIGGIWIYRGCSRRGRRREQALASPWERYTGYGFIAAAAVLMIFFYAAPFMNLPEIFSVDRIFAIIRVFVYAVPWVPVDLLISLALSGRYEKILQRGAILICAGVYCFSYMTDFHEFGFWWIKRFESAIKLTADITEDFDLGSYMIISPHDEVWQVEDGWTCVQLLDFVQTVEEAETYTLPPEYLFLYVEKHPMDVGTKQYFAGPEWLGRKSSQFEKFNWSRWYPEVIKCDISREAAEESLDYNWLKRDYNGAYVDEWVRTILCSKAYYWYQDFSEAHPTETNIYYEDEDFICYVIHQNPEKPLELTMRG